MSTEKTKQSEISEKMKKKASGLLSSFMFKTWPVTLLFFFTILGAAVWVWWTCLYHPVPSPAVKAKTEQGKKDYEAMKKSIEDVLFTLKEREKKLLSPPDFSSQKELFLQAGAPPAAPAPAAKAAEPKTLPKTDSSAFQQPVQ